MRSFNAATLFTAGLLSCITYMASSDFTDGDSALETVQAEPVKDAGIRIIEEAERYLGIPFNMGGRLGKVCKRTGRRGEPFLDCQSLAIFAYSAVFGDFEWCDVPVHNNKLVVESGLLGKPIAGLDGVLREQVDEQKLHAGDFLYFLRKDFVNDDTPLLIKNGQEYLTWHTGVYKGGSDHLVLHSSPLAKKVIQQPLEEISYDALFVTRR